MRATIKIATMGTTKPKTEDKKPDEAVIKQAIEDKKKAIASNKIITK